MSLNTPYCLIKGINYLLRCFRTRILEIGNVCLSQTFGFLCFLEPIFAIHPALPAWRRTRAIRSVGTGARPDFSMAVRNMAPAVPGVTTVCQLVARVLVAHGGWAGWGLPGSYRGQGDIRSKAGERKLPREVSLECIMHLSGLSAFVGPRGNKLAHDCWWCVHICVGVCGVL